MAKKHGLTLILGLSAGAGERRPAVGMELTEKLEGERSFRSEMSCNVRGPSRVCVTRLVAREGESLEGESETTGNLNTGVFWGLALPVPLAFKNALKGSSRSSSSARDLNEAEGAMAAFDESLRDSEVAGAGVWWWPPPTPFERPLLGRSEGTVVAVGGSSALPDIPKKPPMNFLTNPTTPSLGSFSLAAVLPFEGVTRSYGFCPWVEAARLGTRIFRLSSS